MDALLLVLRSRDVVAEGHEVAQSGLRGEDSRLLSSRSGEGRERPSQCCSQVADLVRTRAEFKARTGLPLFTPLGGSTPAACVPRA
jgi:hypothetical protein